MRDNVTRNNNKSKKMSTYLSLEREIGCDKDVLVNVVGAEEK